MVSAFDWAVTLGLVSTRGRLPGRKTRQQAKLIVPILSLRAVTGNKIPTNDDTAFQCGSFPPPHCSKTETHGGSCRSAI